MRRKRIDIICDLDNPTTYLDITAVAMYNRLVEDSSLSVGHEDIDAAIIAGGGRVRLKGDAKKALNNLGYDVICSPAGSYTTYKINSTVADKDRVYKRKVSYILSDMVSFCRSLAEQPQTKELKRAYKRAVDFTLFVGTDEALGGLSHAAVLHNLKPLSAVGP